MDGIGTFNLWGVEGEVDVTVVNWISSRRKEELDYKILSEY